MVGELSAGWGFFRRGTRLVTWFELAAQGHDDMSDHDCECGYQAESAEDLIDHLGDVFLADNDIAPDGRVHAEAADSDAPGRRCLYGFAADAALALDDHLLCAFIPDDRIGRDGGKHSGAADITPEYGQFPA